MTDERRSPTPTDWALAAAIGLRALYGLAMLPLIPLLIASHPLLLQLLSGSTVSEVVVGARVRLGEISWPVAILAGLPAWVLFDWLYWWAGVRWGDRALRLVMGRGDPDRARQRAKRVEAAFARFGAGAVLLAKFLPVPGPLVYAAAGTTGMRLGTFVLLNLAGTLLTATVVVSLGFALGQRAVDLVELFRQYALVVAVVVVGVLVAVQLARRRRARGQ